jgi:predicted nuclease of predicted toxin-antitoxin system
MNLSPSWVPVLERNGFPAVHWSSIGDKRAPDPVVLAWAREHEHVVFTNDLGVGAILAASGDATPSVIQIRAQDLTPDHLENMLVAALRQHADVLQQGTIISIDEVRSRARVLPLAR